MKPPRRESPRVFSMGDELKRGFDAIRKEHDRKEKGHEVSEHRESFDTGWDTGRWASDPDEPGTPGDVRKRVRREYGGLGSDARKAYRDGYSTGSHR